MWWRAGEAIAREWLPVWQAIDALRDFVCGDTKSRQVGKEERRQERVAA